MFDFLKSRRRRRIIEALLELAELDRCIKSDELGFTAEEQKTQGRRIAETRDKVMTAAADFGMARIALAIVSNGIDPQPVQNILAYIIRAARQPTE